MVRGTFQNAIPRKLQHVFFCFFWSNLRLPRSVFDPSGGRVLAKLKVVVVVGVGGGWAVRLSAG